MKFKIPQELIEMIRQQRLIPFLGAGFSAGLNLPNWDEMLKKLSDEIEDSLPYEEVKKLCNNDPLQVAEYFYLKCDRNIGPLRHAISTFLRTDIDPTLSGAHVDLVNLGCKQIYTTNYDDLIETTFKKLKVPFSVIALPKHVATSSGGKVQIVKYHGDLRHEATLVLTESSYYRRLDFESPMDLKFRSDLLGRSVLFMGYSFRDINIRIIWFKLMEMMKDIPMNDRPTSFIVRFDPNPVLETLYEAVGIKTIVLDEAGECNAVDNRTRHLNEFMFELAEQSLIKNKIPGSNDYPFLSITLIDHLKSQIDVLDRQIKDKRKNIRLLRLRNPELEQFNHIISLINNRRFPKSLISELENELNRILDNSIILNRLSHELASLAVKYLKRVGQSDFVTTIIVLGLSNLALRENILQNIEDWTSIWSSQLSDLAFSIILKQFERELNNHKEEIFEIDEDLAYLIDIFMRIIDGYLYKLPEEQKSKITSYIDDAAQIYPSIESYKFDKDGPPNVKNIIHEIEKRQMELQDTIEEPDDFPF